MGKGQVRYENTWYPPAGTMEQTVEIDLTEDLAQQVRKLSISYNRQQTVHTVIIGGRFGGIGLSRNNFCCGV